MKRVYITILSIALLLISCQNVIDLSDKYANEHYLVMNSIVTADSLVRISITRSVFLLDYDTSQSFPIVENAMVVLKVNDQSEQLHVDSTAVYTSTLRPKAGDSVFIWATDNIDTIWSKTIVPEPVDITIDTVCINKNFIWTLEYRRDSLGQLITDSEGNYIRDTTGWDMRPLYKVTVGVNDPYPQRDGYLASAQHISKYRNGELSTPTSYSPAWRTTASSSAANLLLSQLGYNVTTTSFTSDSLLNGQLLEFTVMPYFYVNNMSQAMSQQVEHVYLVVNVYHLTYEYYLFLATANLSDYSGNTSLMSLLGEPKHTYSNIQDGLGIVGAQTLISDTITLY